MASTPIADRLREFISTEIMYEDTTTALADDTPLLGGILDSLDLMRLVAFISDDLEAPVADSEITKENFDTLRDIEQLVTRKLKDPS